MGILTGKAILQAVKDGDIVIEDFDKKRLNPNSYNLRLGKQMIVYNEKVLDMREINEPQYFNIPPDGLVLEPGRLYLGQTMEYTETDKYIPMLEGRSSVGRLGLAIHITAGFGDVGFKGNWTLELFCVQKVRIYAGVEIAQIYYLTPEGEIGDLYKGKKYQGQRRVTPSMMWRDFLSK